MYLDAVSTEEVPVYDAGEGRCGAEIFGTWKHWHPAAVSHHGQACCEIVKEWIISSDQSLLNGGNDLTGPRWLRQRFEWGPAVPARESMLAVEQRLQRRREGWILIEDVALLFYASQCFGWIISLLHRFPNLPQIR